VSIERGLDPGKFVFMPFGGGGALHAGAMLREVGIASALVPRYPGVTSAMGCVIADMRQDYVQTLNAFVAAIDLALLAEHMQSHVDRGMALLNSSNTSFETTHIGFELDMAYAGQTHTVSVPLTIELDSNRVIETTKENISSAFDAAYEQQFGRLLPDGVRRVINLRTAVTGIRPKFDLRSLAPATNNNVSPTPKASRRVYFDTQGHDTAIFDRLLLPAKTVLTGPAILEQPDSTVLIEPGYRGRVDGFGNTIIEPVEAKV